MSEDLTPIEREWGKQLASQQAGPCLEADALIELAERGRRIADYRARMDHVLTCPVCRARLISLRSTEVLHRKALRANGWFGLLPQGRREPISAGMRWPLLGAGAAVLMLVVLAVVSLHSRPTAITLNDVSGPIALDVHDRLSGLPDLPADLREPVAVALRSGSLPIPGILGRLNPEGRAALRQGPFTVQGPTGTVITNSQPQFSWKLPAGAAGCKVVITSVEGTGPSLVTKMLTKEHWKPKRPLESGRILAWQVIALNRSGREIARMPVRPDAARFEVIARSNAAALDRIRQATHGSHLAMGIALTGEGVLDDAEAEFDALQRANSQSEPAKKLLERVRSFRSGA